MKRPSKTHSPSHASAPAAVAAEKYDRIATRSLALAHPSIYGLSVELSQNLDAPEELTIDMVLLPLNLHSTSHDGNGQYGDVRNPDAIRALGGMLIACADEAERRGMLTACRRHYNAPAEHGQS